MTILAEEAHSFPKALPACSCSPKAIFPSILIRRISAVDVFTCGGMTQKAIDYLKSVLQPSHVKEMVVTRGLPEA